MLKDDDRFVCHKFVRLEFEEATFSIRNRIITNWLSQSDQGVVELVGRARSQ